MNGYTIPISLLSLYLISECTAELVEWRIKMQRHRKPPVGFMTITMAISQIMYRPRRAKRQGLTDYLLRGIAVHGIFWGIVLVILGIGYLSGWVV